MKKTISAIIVALTVGSLASAESLSFVEVWSKINDSSSAQESSRLQAQALSAAEGRASRHWLPKVYLDAKTYQTNDPGPSFFGLLEQRSIRQTDFSPDSLNHPDARIYTRGALGVDWALYEGGMKSSQVDFFKHSAAAQENTTSQVQVEQYSQVGLSYGSLVVLDQMKRRLQTLRSEVERLIKNYQVGNRSNPVGYSGLLGMKSLVNRLNGLINQYDAQSRSHFSALHEMGLSAKGWAPEPGESSTFVSRYFNVDTSGSAPESSYKTDSTREGVKASEQMAEMEKAKFLPRVGAFAENAVFTGDRSTANGYSAGLYLQWNLFDPSAYGSLTEAKLKSRSAAKNSEALEQQERSEKAALRESAKALRDNIDLLNDSYKLLVEQSKITGTLFQNGSINALQLVETTSRRADIIAQQGDAELNLLKVSTQLVTKEKFDIVKHLGAGAKYEKQ